MLDMRWGRNGYHRHTLEEIGNKFNVSRARIHQILRPDGLRGESTGSSEVFTCPQLVKQPWFPIKSVITLRKLIDGGKIKAQLSNPTTKIKRYLIDKADVMRYLDSVTKPSNYE